MNFFRPAPNLIIENFNKTQPTPLDEIAELEQSIGNNLNKDIHISKDVINSFNLKNELNPEIWPNDKLNPKIKMKLLRIAKDFMEDLELPKELKLKDVTFLGSLANYNWSKFSDIDLHIVMDFDQFDAEPEILDNYFYAQKTIWNDEHNIEVFGYPVEISVQDSKVDMVATGVYSVLRDKWLIKPERENFKIDKASIKKKADALIYKLKDIRQAYQDNDNQAVIDKVTTLKDKIKNMRKTGLEKGGEFSIENLVFKTLRRTSFMEILDSFKAKAYDKLMSVVETLNEAVNTKGVIFIKGAKLEDGEQRLFAVQANNIADLKRKKTDNQQGQSASMANFARNQVYRVGLVDGKLKQLGVAWGTEAVMLNRLGLSKTSVALNNNKTPMHWDSLKFDNINQAIQAMGPTLQNIPNIRWVG